MLNQETRTAILALHRQGHGSRAIAKDLGVSRAAVRGVIASGQAEVPRRDVRPRHRLEDWVEAIRDLHAECQGNRVRVLEELDKRHKVSVAYTTLTRFCRQQGIGREDPDPWQRIETGPGEEMQHDTSAYDIEIGGRRVRRQCASLVLGYSRRLYMQFYERYDRFHLKLFMTDALVYFGGACARCVIDNTSVAIACGAGYRAQMAPEVEAFEKRFSFRFMAHAVGHSNRKGKIERPYHWIEHNFLAGRRFKDDADLNRQAVEWCQRGDGRRLRELKATPRELFAAERPRLVPLPLHIPQVYRDGRREVDGYGYVHLRDKRYSAPRSHLRRVVTLREARDQVILLDGHQELARHRKLTNAPGEKSHSTLPEHEVSKRLRRSSPPAEEAGLKSLGPEVAQYLEALKAERGPRYGWSLKRLYALSCQYKTADLVAAIGRAHEHRLFDVARVETILLQNTAETDYLLPLGPQDYEDSPGYRKGAATPPSDLSAYHVDVEAEPEEDDDAR